MTNLGCQYTGHDWMPTGLWHQGALCFPCRHCTAEIRRTRDGKEEILEDSWDTSVHGIKLDLDDDPWGGVTKIVCRELESSYLIESIILEPGDIVLDIGAHVGIVSAYLAKRWSGIQIYALEPVPANYQRLLRNLRANNCTGVTAIKAGVSGNGQIITLRGVPSSNSGGYSVFAREGHRHTVHSVTLEWLFERFDVDQCKLLKIDCEGAEYEVLSAKPELLRRVDYLIGEFHAGPALVGWGHNPPEALLGLVHQHIPAERVHVTTSRIGA